VTSGCPTVSKPYHPAYDTLAELWCDTLSAEMWSFTPVPAAAGHYVLNATELPSGQWDRGDASISAGELALYHLSPTGEYIVFMGHDEIDDLVCLVGGYSRIFTVDPLTHYIDALLPVWHGGTTEQFSQALDAVPSPPNARAAPMCAGNPTAQR
jgi:hypothetical protein